MNLQHQFSIKLFADGADKQVMLDLASRSYISGLTTNPTLMRKAGISDYKSFCKEILHEIKDKPISFEVFSDEFEDMYRQAIEINSWGSNVFVKIPITNTKGISSCSLVERLAYEGVRVNVTAIMTIDQTKAVAKALNKDVPSNVSIFAGRIADTGRDPIPIMKEALAELHKLDQCELIWASPRELLNIVQADAIGCDIITATPDILNKLSLWQKNLEQFSLETVRMFYDDAKNSNYQI